MSINVQDMIRAVDCPHCGARPGRGCSWFYGYDDTAVHPERFERYAQYQTERRKLDEWNKGARA